MKPVFTVREARPSTENHRLRVNMVLRENREEYEIEAQLPAREVAALLPRELLIGSNNQPSTRVFEVINELLMKLAVGREVRVWEYNDQTYCSFLKWGSVRFVEEDTKLSA